MPSIPGYSDKQLTAWKQQAAKLVSDFDQNKNGAIDANELSKFAYKTTDTHDNYWVGDFCNRTYTYYDVYDKVDEGKFKAVDANKDGKVTADELAEAHRAALPKRDLNGNGKVSWWEKFRAKAVPAVDSLLGVTTDMRQTGKETKNEYSPLRKDWSWAPKL
jgi:hypothetical protein